MTIFDRARMDPEGLALDDGTRRRSWAALADRSTRLARFLREEAGLAPDDHAAILMGNRVEYAEIVLGAILAGVWLTPVNGHLARDEVAYIVRDSGAKLLFTDEAHAEVARAAGAPAVLPVGDPLEGALACASDAPMDLAGPPGATMIYTSGTTGRPKGVKRTRPATLRDALDQHARMGRRYGLDGSGPHLLTGPMYHAAPLLFAIYDQANGAPLVILPRWDEREALGLLAAREIAHTHMVPTMFHRLLALPEAVRNARDLASLRMILHGAAPCPVAVKRSLLEWLGPIVYEYYAATEGFGAFVTPEVWLEHPGTVGKPDPDAVRVLGDHGEPLPSGEIGRLFLQAPGNDRFTYYKDDAKTKRAYDDSGGYFTLGDLGYLDTEGYLYLADRSGDVIISGGVNVYPAEVDAVLLEHPAVADAATIGVPDEEWGESVRSVVERRAGAPGDAALAAELVAFCRGRLAHFKCPRAVDFTDALPRHDTGKIYRRLLRERYWKDHGRRI